MSIVKVSNKETLEILQAKLTLRLGRKLTQQETLDICIKSGLNNIDQLITYIDNPPLLNKEKINKIMEEREKLKNIPYDLDTEDQNKDDKDIYT